MKNKVIIFDCDGTLVDTFLLIEKTVFQTFETLLPDYPLTKDEAHQFFGPFLNDSFKKYVKTDKEVKQLVECYRCINDEYDQTMMNLCLIILKRMMELKNY